MLREFARAVIRPESLKWDHDHGVSHDFLRRIVLMGQAMGGSFSAGPGDVEARSGEERNEQRKKRQPSLSAGVAVEELAWGDSALVLCFPGPGLGCPPLRAPRPA